MARATLFLLAVAIPTASAACPCNYAPSYYTVTPASSWFSRPSFDCSDPGANGHVVCACNCCSDGLLNGRETDVDCGGPCGPCAGGKACVTPSDCLTGVCLAGACSSEQSLYYFGGNLVGHNWGSNPTNMGSKLTMVGNTLAVTATPVMPASALFLHVGVLNQVIYVIDAFDWDVAVYSWHPAGGSWATQTFPDLHYLARYASDVTAGNKIYILGGNTDSFPSAVRSFNGTSFAFEQPDIPAPKAGGFATFYSNKIWFAGGVATGSVWSWDLDPSHPWVTSHPTMAVNVDYATGAVLNGKWCACGGDPRYSVVTTVQCWDFNDAGSWTISPKRLPTYLYFASAQPWHNRLYLLGLETFDDPSDIGTERTANAIWSWSGSDSDEWVVESATLTAAAATGAAVVV